MASDKISSARVAEGQELRAAGPGASDVRFVLLGAFAALVVMLVLLLGSHSASPLGLERRLAANARKALDAAGLSSVQVRMDGQTAYLDGASPDPGARAKAIAAVLGSTASGGWLRGGVTSVDASIAQAAPTAPFDWAAARRGNSLTLTGHVPSPRLKALLLKRAERLFPKTVRDETVVAAGAPEGDWLTTASFALDTLADLPGDADARLVNHTLVLMGEADRKSSEGVKGSFAARGLAPFALVMDMPAPGEGPPELEGIRLAGANQQSCQEAFTKIMARNVINFDTGSAVIDPASKRTLDALASVARRCDGFSIEVSGHTDNAGDRTVNMTLSRARAQAVVDYLSERGVVGRRLSAIGFGPDKPVAPNDTAQGRASNRRIEFAVLS